MQRTKMLMVVGAGCLALAACSSSAQPSDFSNAVRTDSGLAATGAAGAVGGAGAAPRAEGNVATTRVR